MTFEDMQVPSRASLQANPSGAGVPVGVDWLHKHEVGSLLADKTPVRSHWIKDTSMARQST